MRPRSTWQQAFSLGSRFFFASMLLVSLVLIFIGGLGAIVVLFLPLLLALIFGGSLAVIALQIPENIGGLFASLVLGAVCGFLTVFVASALFVLIFWFAPGLVAGLIYGEMYYPLWSELLIGPYILAGIPGIYLLTVPAAAVSGWLIWRNVHRLV